MKILSQRAVFRACEHGNLDTLEKVIERGNPFRQSSCVRVKVQIGTFRLRDPTSLLESSPEIIRDNGRSTFGGGFFILSA